MMWLERDYLNWHTVWWPFLFETLSNNVKGCLLQKQFCLTQFPGVTVFAKLQLQQLQLHLDQSFYDVQFGMSSCNIEVMAYSLNRFGEFTWKILISTFTHNIITHKIHISNNVHLMMYPPLPILDGLKGQLRFCKL